MSQNVNKIKHNFLKSYILEMTIKAKYKKDM